jgi:hypothetical protein
LIPSQRRQLGRQARLDMSQHAWDTIAAQFEGVLDQVTSHH